MGIITINKKTGWRGVASRQKDGLIFIFEGAPDGSDDKVLDSAEFEKGYLSKFIAGEETKEEYDKLEQEEA